MLRTAARTIRHRLMAPLPMTPMAAIAIPSVSVAVPSISAAAVVARGAMATMTTITSVPSLSYVSRRLASTSTPSAAAAPTSYAPVPEYKTYPPVKTFSKILIANRGEIACRIIKTCKRMGIKTVAIYSEADRHSMHVKLADEAVCVGPAASKDGYLNIERIVAACKVTGAQAVHPGYGFLSEKVVFQSALEKEGIVFIGPKARALTEMGDKIQSKQIARQAGVNTIPGDANVAKNAEEVIAKANKIGYPVMVKAKDGGGGKGMRIAWNDQEARDGFRLSTQEAMSSFASDAVFVEKFIEEPRHIEIQLLADSHGNAVYVFERECSIQRRNQKVIEEAPSTFLDAATRKAMGEQAVALAKAVDYQSAGTVEFLVDKHRNFYFLEMNTRLQVEHPVSEAISGIDLVEHMIRVAAGHKLPFKQSDITLKGWSFESRVYAEDPLRGFLPSIGRLKRYTEPVGEGVRCDSGIEEGAAISIYYDPMICKLITYGESRDIALDRMRTALDSYVIRGVTHNINFLRALCDHPRFKKGAINTNFIPEEYPKGFLGHQLTGDEKQLLASAAVLLYSRAVANQVTLTGAQSSFDATSFHAAKLGRLVVTLGGEKLSVETKINRTSADAQDLTVKLTNSNGQSTTQVVTSPYQIGDLVVDTIVNGVSHTLQVLHTSPTSFAIQLKGTEYEVSVHSPAEDALIGYMPKKAVIDTSKIIQSPMPGAVFSVAVKVGDRVAAGQEVCVLEAMKMQNALRATGSGVVKAVHVKPGQTVARDEILVEFE